MKTDKHLLKFNGGGQEKQKRPSRSLLRRARRRAVMPGFPSMVPFNSIAEIEVYFSGPRVTCLVCGKQYKSLSSHLLIHSMTGDEYRAKLNIPWTYPLDSSQSSTVKSESHREYLSDPEALTALMDHASLARQALAQTDPTTFRSKNDIVLQGAASNLPISIEVTCACGRTFGTTSSHPSEECPRCRQKHKPLSDEQRVRRRQIAKRHYYKDLERTRALLRERARKIRTPSSNKDGREGK